MFSSEMVRSSRSSLPPPKGFIATSPTLWRDAGGEELSRCPGMALPARLTGNISTSISPLSTACREVVTVWPLKPMKRALPSPLQPLGQAERAARGHVASYSACSSMLCTISTST